MKKLITLVLVSLSVVIYAQNSNDYDSYEYNSESVITHKIKNFPELEIKVCELINKERVKHGLNKVKRDSIVDEVAYHQNFYLSHNEIPLGHEQEIDIENFEEISDLQDRVHHFMGNKYYGGEIAQYYTSYDYYRDMSNVYTKHWADSTTEDITNHIAQQIVRDWMNSPGHKNAILNKTFTFNKIGVSITEYEERNKKYPDYWNGGSVAIVVFTN